MTDSNHNPIEIFLTDVEEQQVIDAIRDAELNTSGEIRVHLENCCDNSYERAAEVFSILKMHNTRYRNGVLIYVAVQNKTFSIIGDKGINMRVDSSFWDSTKNIIEFHFKKGLFAEGLAQGITSVGEQLKTHFPWTSDDNNELPNTISRS